QDDQEAVPQRGINDPIEHGALPSTGSFGKRTGSPTGPLFLALRSALAKAALQEFRPEHVASLGGHHLPADHASHAFGRSLALRPRPDLPDVEDLGGALLQEVLVAHEDNVAVPVPLDRLVRNNHGVLLLPEYDPAGAERVGAKPAIGIGQLRPNLHG